MKSKFLFMFLYFVATVLTVVTAQSKSDFINVTSGVKYQYIGTYDIARLNTILTTEAEKFIPFKVTYTEAKNAVKLYRITYASVIPEFNNKPVIAMGLLALPETGKAKMKNGK